MEITRTIIAVCLGLVVASQAQDCSKPVPGPNMNLKDSDIVLTTFPDGSRATFVCSLGHTPAVGSGVVTCTAGTWTKVTLHCKKKICGSPGQVDNGEIEYHPGNEFGDKLVVTCNLGFRLVGKRELTCGDQGWLGRLPVCEVVTCDLPAGIPNGLFSPVKDVYNYREVVQYSCTGDLILSGSKSVTCSEDGTFTPGPPQCTEVECSHPKVANGEWASGSRPPHKYLATVTYSCNDGYKMEGDATIECGLNGQWMPGIPKCTAVTCSPPPTITSGTFSPQKPLYQYLETVAYSCDQGFTLSGSKSLSCSLDGTFKGSPPTCSTVTCSPPPTITSGTFSPQKPLYQYLETVAYSCDQGFTLSGSKSLSCSLDGTFNGSPPTCSKKTCGSPGQVDNGEIEYLSGKEFGDKLVVTCNPGFRLVGKRALTCGDQGWLGRLPECEEVECSDPKVANGEWVSGSRPPYKYLATMTYRCNDGYEMEGDATMVCGLNGQWMPGIPKCIGPPSPIVAVVVGTLVGVLIVGGIVGFLVYRKKRESSRKDLHGKQGTETEEEVALSEGEGGAENIRRVWPCLSYCSLAACFTVSCCFRGSCLWNG